MIPNVCLSVVSCQNVLRDHKYIWNIALGELTNFPQPTTWHLANGFALVCDDETAFLAFVSERFVAHSPQ